MKKMLSVYFSSDRTYLSVAEPGEKGLKLNYINATQSPVDLENPEDIDTMESAEEVKKLLSETGDDISRVSVTLPADSVLVTKIPAKSNMKFEEIKKLVELEIRQAYPQFNYNDFIPSVIHFEPKLDGKEIMLATIIPKQDFISCKEVLHDLGKPITNIEISQLNAHSAFLYNYPEKRHETVALIGVGLKFMDISVIVGGKPLYYNLAKLKNKEDIGSVCLEEFGKITGKYVQKINSAFFFGEGLDNEMLGIAQSSLGASISYVGKLNAFRMFTTELDERQRDYCSRVAHLFPPCIGGNLPAYHKKIRMF